MVIQPPRRATAFLIAAMIGMARPQTLHAQQAQNVTTTGGLVTQVHFIPDPPKAGPPLLAWFMLTQVGHGRSGHHDISAQRCRCVLAIYGAGGPSSTPIAKPTLRAVTANGRPDHLGANVTFPSPGQYVVQLAGRPTKAGDFPPFRTDFVIEVIGS